MSFAITKFCFSGALFKRILVWKQVFFQKLVSRMKLLLSLQFCTCHIASIGCENMFLLVLLVKSKFFTRVTLLLHLLALVQHSCHTCIALMLLMSHLCCTRVVHVALASNSCRLRCTRIAHVQQLCCKIDQITRLRTTYKKNLIINERKLWIWGQVK